jgi:hypothetical protein
VNLSVSDHPRKLFVRSAVALGLALVCLVVSSRAEEPISFVFPAANFQPVPADAYPLDETPPQAIVEPSTATTSTRFESVTAPLPPQSTSLTPPPVPPQPTEMVSPEATDSDSYLPNEMEEPYCRSCNGSNSPSGGCLPPGRLPNGQYPDDWMWGCGGWPYANGPGTCDDWKVGPIWDVTVDGMVMTRENADLAVLQAGMNPPPVGTPIITEQFDRGPGGRVYLTGLVPRNVGYQVMAGYEGIEEWNAAIVFPETPTFPPFGEPTTRRNLFYRSSLHSGELNIVRTCNPAFRPYCGVRYIKFDDEIWDQSVQTMTPVFPPSPGPTTELDTLNAFDIENNLIGFQGGVKYDVWNWGKRFSLQGFLNSGVYYNKAKYSNMLQEAETIWTGSSVTSGYNESLTIVEQSNIAYVGEASLTAVCRLNRCWAGRAGYQVLFIDGISLASDAYLNTGVTDRSLIFHGWHAGIECRR